MKAKPKPEFNLISTLKDGSFFRLAEDDALGLVKEKYFDELDMLKTSYSIPDPTGKRPDFPSPSMRLYGAEFDEINRTLVGVLALRWISDKDFASFVGHQPSDTSLTRQSFDWICNIFEHGIKTSDDLYALITSVIINDLGKSSTLAMKSNVDICKVNHDMILYQVVAKQPSLIPSLDDLRLDHKSDLILGLKLGAEFNFGQLAQAENVPACLSGLEAMQGRTRAFEMRFIEQILDIAGALGHVDHTGAKKLTEPVFQSYQSVYEIAINIINGKMSLRDGYDMILTRKVDLLVKAGWRNDRPLDVRNPEHRALMRLLCIGNATDADGADLICETVLDVVSDHVRRLLIQGLNVDGSEARPAVQATYIPAMCNVAIKNTKTNSKAEKQKALASIFRYLARTLVIDMKQIQKKLPHGVTVIERDLRRTILDILNSDRFREDPDVLDHVDVPDDEVANVAKTSEVTSE
ncbi:MAG: hypothetical protein Q9211_002861 [Gyalolechia sp. 1 TL-2023]